MLVNYRRNVRGNLKPNLIAYILMSASIYAGLSACAATKPDELAAYSSITFSAPGFYLPPRSSLRWRSDLIYLFGDGVDAPKTIQPFLQEEIENYLESRGNIFPEDGSSADYGLVAVVVLGDDLTARDVLKEFRLTPSFQASNRYERGTIVVAVYSAADESVRWRGAIRANVDLQMPAESRRQLVREHARRLLKMLPVTPPS